MCGYVDLQCGYVDGDGLQFGYVDGLQCGYMAFSYTQLQYLSVTLKFNSFPYKIDLWPTEAVPSGIAYGNKGVSLILAHRIHLGIHQQLPCYLGLLSSHLAVDVHRYGCLLQTICKYVKRTANLSESGPLYSGNLDPCIQGHYEKSHNRLLEPTQ